MAKNEALGRAKDARQDEFYTQLADIENELRHYRPHFKGKTVLCNCDDPYESNFFKYFALNFNKLRLKRLVATCYSGSSITGTQLPLFGDGTEEDRRTPYKAIVTSVHDTTGEGYPIKNRTSVLITSNATPEASARQSNESWSFAVPVVSPEI